MSRTIWKFPLPLEGRILLDMPDDAEILSVDNQGGTLCLWATVTSTRPSRQRSIVIVGTGNPMPPVPATFIGTVLVPPFVWHVFETPF